MGVSTIASGTTKLYVHSCYPSRGSGDYHTMYNILAHCVANLKRKVEVERRREV